MKTDMRTVLTSISGVILLIPNSFSDNRGSFSETYSKSKFETVGIDLRFIQDNRSQSISAGTIRGLHFQTQPFAQSKLVSVQRGRVFDVAVDLRRSSSTFLQHVAVELTADGGEQLFIPAGFAHGFCTLEPDTVVTYKVDAYYAPAHEAGFHWLTPALNIEWPCRAEDGILSPKDAVLPDRIDPEACFP
jgi:dTDP-4-dehydrorhamnose 3,5-epimerase